jgi:predicted DCC family thiol-disulfide oxidoreductase YuxK
MYGWYHDAKNHPGWALTAGTASRRPSPYRYLAAMADSNSPVLLYDGLCGFCDGTVQFVLKRDTRGTMRFATLQGEYARAVLANHRSLQGIDSLILIETMDGVAHVRVRSDAVLGLARYLGGRWRALAVMRVIPRALRDLGYDIFARFRYRWFGRYDACPLPSPDVRARFID